MLRLARFMLRLARLPANRGWNLSHDQDRYKRRKRIHVDSTSRLSTQKAVVFLETDQVVS